MFPRLIVRRSMRIPTARHDSTLLIGGVAFVVVGGILQLLASNKVTNLVYHLHILPLEFLRIWEWVYLQLTGLPRIFMMVGFKTK